MTHDRTRTLHVKALSRVEGEGAMLVETRGDDVERVELQIYEPPRFFEAFLRDRGFREVPDITARICGICPVAYQMSACLALEDACGITVDERVNDLRRLLYCGEWISSHGLHVTMLHAPDFLGYPGAVEMAADHRGLVERGLRVKKAGNDILRTVGGRSVHPINVAVGGFHRAPTPAELAPVAESLRAAREDAEAMVRWAAALPFPDFSQDYVFVALQRSDGYAVLDGRVTSSDGLDVDVATFDARVTESHVPHSTALHAHLDGDRRYMVGPMARWALSGDRMTPLARTVAADVGLERPCRNPFRSILVRCVEILHACDLAIGLIENYDPPGPTPVTGTPPHAGVGYGATEAPRGLLFHRYAVAADGSIIEADIVPPTSQNQAQIEDDLRRFVQPRIHEPEKALTASCEQAIRNYDPCISCSTHFLDLTVVRR